jgi:hypothetical protein
MPVIVQKFCLNEWKELIFEKLLTFKFRKIILPSLTTISWIHQVTFAFCQ